ncbi:MAG: protein adenylyltransferase SelO [Shimia sp.]|uniref:protein adenylyltransferase SelO n=1 Tax=Shimia sp. TaxID=1954381 RepID=UPI004058B129
MSLYIPFHNTYARLPERFFAQQAPTPVRAPKLLAFNAPLAASLGITGADDTSLLTQVFSGSVVPDGAEPLAQLYSGHQFGNWNPQLGDGRAVLLGESNGYDIQLKGSGPTPFSRRGDGRSWLGPVLREYVVSEAMHALGIPTTRALAAVSTGEDVFRERLLPGGVMTRVASSHLRVGTFQALYARKDVEGLETLMNFAITRHYPDAQSPAEFLAAVIAAQAELIARWMSVGFIHGVMNTDNCSISGETIDYGPCAFMDGYNPMQVFSSIDRNGRYAFDNQPEIIVWNMAQLATTLVPLMPDGEAAVETFTALVHDMPNQIRAHQTRLFAAKIGLTHVREGDQALIDDLLDLMAKDGADFTNTFRSLPAGSASDQLIDRKAFGAWERRWQDRLQSEPNDPQTTLRAANPALIPRNHRIEEMISAAIEGDMAPFERLLAALATPFSDPGDFADLTRPPMEAERVHQTFCGT